MATGYELINVNQLNCSAGAHAQNAGVKISKIIDALFH